MREDRFSPRGREKRARLLLKIRIAGGEFVAKGEAGLVALEGPGGVPLGDLGVADPVDNAGSMVDRA